MIINMLTVIFVLICCIVSFLLMVFTKKTLLFRYIPIVIITVSFIFITIKYFFYSYYLIVTKLFDGVILVLFLTLWFFMMIEHVILDLIEDYSNIRSFFRIMYNRIKRLKFRYVRLHFIKKIKNQSLH